jgi:hypothetical protein
LAGPGSGRDEQVAPVSRHGVSPTDCALKAAVENGSLPPSEFGHRAHVALAYAYLAQGGLDPALKNMRRGLRAYLQHHGIDAAKFHETLTRAWVLAVWHFMQRTGDTHSADDLIERNPALRDSSSMLTHYSAELLFSTEARQRFVEPDLEPIPGSPPGKS